MNPPLHPEELKAQLRMRFGTLSKFERDKGLPLRSVSQVLAGRAILPTAEAIADVLDIPLHRVSAHYHNLYDKLSTIPRYRLKASRAHLQNGEAA